MILTAIYYAFVTIVFVCVRYFSLFVWYLVSFLCTFLCEFEIVHTSVRCDIKLVFHSSTFAMMHCPINISIGYIFASVYSFVAFIRIALPLSIVV